MECALLHVIELLIVYKINLYNVSREKHSFRVNDDFLNLVRKMTPAGGLEAKRHFCQRYEYLHEEQFVEKQIMHLLAGSDLIESK